MSIQELQTSRLDINNNYEIDVTLKQLDDIVLKIIVYDKSLPADLSNYTARLKAFKSDQVPLIQNTQIYIDNNEVTIIGDHQLGTTSGIVKAELQFVNKTTFEKKSTFYININVVASVLETDRGLSVATCTLLKEIDNKLDQIENIGNVLEDAIEVNNELKDTTTPAAHTANLELQSTIDDANISKLALDASNENATNTKNTLDSLNTNAINTKNALDISKNDAETIKESLETFVSEHQDVTDISNQLNNISSQMSENTQQIANKVDKVIGKGLSTNDYDDTEKSKVALITNKADIVDLNTQRTRIDNLVATSSGSFYQKCLSTDTGALLVVASGATTGQINLASVTPVATGYTPVAGDYVRLVYGVASGSAELIDGRTGADGVVNTNIGSAIRTQNNVILNEIIYQVENVVGKYSKNAYIPSVSTLLSRYDVGCKLTSTGVSVVGSASGNQIVNIIIPVSMNKTYKFEYNSVATISVLGLKLATEAPTTWSNTGFINTTKISTGSNTYIIVYFQLGTNISGAINFSLREETGNTLTQEIENINEMLVLRESRNLYNPAQLESGLIGADGKVSAVADYSVTGFFPIKTGQTIYFSRYKVAVNIYQYALYDINKNLISRTSSYISSYTGTSGVAYVRVGMLTANFITPGFQVEYDKITNYQSYFDSFYRVKLPYITVSKDGKCDYTTVTDAVAESNDGEKIIIYPGIYDNEQIEAWGKTVHLIGLDKKKTIISNSTDEYATPPLEIASGSVSNLTIIAETGGNTSGSHAYAVHVEDAVLYNNTLEFDNCCFKATNGATVGMGMRGLCDVEFNNCELLSQGYNAVGTSGYAVYFHDTVDGTSLGEEKVTFKNCILEGTHPSGVVARIDSNGLDGVSVNMVWAFNILANEHYSNTYLSLHNNSGVANTDWNGLKGYKMNIKSFGNNTNQLNYSA